MADTAVDCIKYLRDTAIAADTAIGSRIYMSIAPQSGSYPMAVMEIISREESPTQAIGSAMDTYRVQVDVFAKNTTGTSGFDAANAVANALRIAWSRTGNTGDYTNIIDGIQEVDYRTDFLPDLQVFQVSNDYMVRVSPNGEVNMANYSLTEQVWRGSKWLNGETIYWKTAVITGASTYTQFDNLPNSGGNDEAGVEILSIVPAHIVKIETVHVGDPTVEGFYFESTEGIHCSVGGKTYLRVNPTGMTDTYYVTLYYTKT